VTPDPRARALAALREGRVRIAEALDFDVIHERPGRIVAYVASSRPDGDRHIVDLAGGEWTCVDSHGEHQQPCVHVAAVQLVTGHDSPAFQAKTRRRRWVTT